MLSVHLLVNFHSTSSTAQRLNLEWVLADPTMQKVPPELLVNPEQMPKVHLELLANPELLQTAKDGRSKFLALVVKQLVDVVVPKEAALLVQPPSLYLDQHLHPMQALKFLI
jgi:hypothetical protein